MRIIAPCSSDDDGQLLDLDTRRDHPLSRHLQASEERAAIAHMCALLVVRATIEAERMVSVDASHPSDRADAKRRLGCRDASEGRRCPRNVSRI